MILNTFGVGKRQITASEIIRSSSEAEIFDEIFLLPIPSSRDQIHVTDTDIPLTDLLRDPKGRRLIAGYGIPLDIAREATAKGIRIADVLTDERFLRDNAELTAHGAVGYILTGRDRAISDLCCGIVGYGRIGRLLCRLLLFLGASAVVFTHREEVRLELCGMGIDARGTDDIGKAGDLDVLINTAPARLITEESANSLTAGGCEIIELASGDNLPRGTSVTRLPSIPDRNFPISAGKIYAAAVLRYIAREARG